MDKILLKTTCISWGPSVVSPEVFFGTFLFNRDLFNVILCIRIDLINFVFIIFCFVYSVVFICILCIIYFKKRSLLIKLLQYLWACAIVFNFLCLRPALKRKPLWPRFPVRLLGSIFISFITKRIRTIKLIAMRKWYLLCAST
jgi:hypothetical protein